MKSSIMVVDDVAESRDTAAALLTADGYDVSTASDGEEALEGISKLRPSAVLFQIRDPARGVIDFVRLLALSRQAFVPVVVVTALNEYQVGSFLNGVPGIRRILHFPCSPEDLRRATAQVVRYAQAN